jgi:hypothetical protein
MVKVRERVFIAWNRYRGKGKVSISSHLPHTDMGFRFE